MEGEIMSQPRRIQNRALGSYAVWITSFAMIAGLASPTLASSSAAAYAVQVEETELAFLGGSSYDSVGTVDLRVATSQLPPPHDLARRITWMLRTALQKSGRFETLGNDPEFLIVPSVTDFSYKNRGGRGLARFTKGIGVGGALVSVELGLRLRIVASGSGEELDSLETSGKAKKAQMQASGQGVYASTEGLGDTPVGKAVEEAIGSAVDRLERSLDDLAAAAAEPSR
jgi:curli biogenesis system outer membrane secretion channel CsgG